MKRVTTSILLLLLLCGCGQAVTVTRFNALPVPSGGQTFAVVPQGSQNGNLEFQHVADLVAAALAAHGYQPVASGDATKADLAVLLLYGPAGSRTQAIPYAPVHSYPWWGGPQYDVFTTFSHYLAVDMFDEAARRRGENRMVFQGRAYTDTSEGEFNVALPYLVQALFERFPGVNGETVRVKVPAK
jgi:hypothetical protein